MVRTLTQDDLPQKTRIKGLELRLKEVRDLLRVAQGDQKDSLHEELKRLLRLKTRLVKD